MPLVVFFGVLLQQDGVLPMHYHGLMVPLVAQGR